MKINVNRAIRNKIIAQAALMDIFYIKIYAKKHVHKVILQIQQTINAIFVKETVNIVSIKRLHV